MGTDATDLKKTPGIIPKACEMIFEWFNAQTGPYPKPKVAFSEVYNETVIDLFDKDNILTQNNQASKFELTFKELSFIEDAFFLMAKAD